MITFHGVCNLFIYLFILSNGQMIPANVESPYFSDKSSSKQIFGPGKIVKSM